MHKLFQVNPNNYISVDSVSGITFENQFAVVHTNSGVKHRITHEQARLLLSCFDLVKPIIEVETRTLSVN